MPLGQVPQSRWGQIKEWIKFLAKLPIIALLTVASAMFGWIGFWFIMRLGVFIYDRYLSNWW